jgi:hypothetical protein
VAEFVWLGFSIPSGHCYTTQPVTCFEFEIEKETHENFESYESMELARDAIKLYIMMEEFSSKSSRDLFLIGE